MTYTHTSVLEGEDEDIREVTPTNAVLLRRLGLEALPAHETMILPTERLIVASADHLVRSAKRLVKSIQQVGILQNPSVVVQEGVDIHAAEATFEVIAKEEGSAGWVRGVEGLHWLIDEGVGMTVDDLAAFGFDRATLAERLKMAQLPSPLLSRILAGDVSREVARKLTRLTQAQQERVAGVGLAGEEITAARVKDILRAQINAGLVPIQTELVQGWNTPPSHTSAQSHSVALTDPANLSPQHCLTASGCEELVEQAAYVGKENVPDACSNASTSSLSSLLDALHAFEHSPGYRTAPKPVQTLTH